HRPSLALYPLSLHDALPIFRTACTARGSGGSGDGRAHRRALRAVRLPRPPPAPPRGSRDRLNRAPPVGQIRGPARYGSSTSLLLDRKSTRLNSSHVSISYAA